MLRSQKQNLLGENDMQNMMGRIRRCAEDYNMIAEGDKIAVGVSGGKDSLTLLYLLAALRRYYPAHYELQAVTIDMGLPGMDFSPVAALCEKLEVPYQIKKTEIGPIIFDYRHEKNPCSMCAKMRRGALNDVLLSLGCNKIAYAHHKDDVIETMLLSLLYEGRFYSFPPKTYLDQMDLTVIRPLFFVDEADVIGFWHKYQLPVAKSPCPADGHTRREYSKQLLRQLNLENPGVKNRMFTAILNAELSDWPDRIIPDRH